MQDEGLTTPATLSTAEAAINYMLQRVQVDADLRHHMIGTEAFSRLCQAEAARVGGSDEDVKTRYSTPTRKGLPKLVQCRQLLEKIGDLAENGQYSSARAIDACSKIAEMARECP